MLKKILAVGIILLFVGASVAPVISGISYKSNTSKLIMHNESQDTSLLTFYIFDKSEIKQQEVLLPNYIVENISDMFKELKFKFEFDPLGVETQVLLVDFVDLLDLYGMIPSGLSRDYVLSLVNPPWFKFLNRVLSFTADTPFLRRSVLNFLNSYFKVDDRVVSEFFDKPYLSSEVVLMCNIASAGLGIPFPFFMLPRPRGVALWAASDAYTAVGSLLQTKNFIASGNQQGVALGFIGFGISAYFGLFGYALIGYAALLVIRAENFKYVSPPNIAPVISDENPSDGSVGVPVSLSELSFRISDGDGDRMSYSVTTSPDVGSSSGSFKKDGVYSVPVSGLEPNTGYSWTVEVSDGKNITVKQFSFYTEMKPFDPFDEGWSYRKKVTVDHDLVEGDLSDFPVLVSVVDEDLRDKAQSDGDDILFMDDSGIANRMFHEIEKYDRLTGELVTWVNIPNVSSNSDTSFFMYYGNPSCFNQQAPDLVWDSDYVMVQHLEETSGIHYDSTSNNMDGNPIGGVLQDSLGMIDGADYFDGTNDYVDILDSSSVEYDTMTISVWVKKDSLCSATEERIIVGKHQSDIKKGWFIEDYRDEGWAFYIGYNAPGKPVRITAGETYDTFIFYHVVGVYDNGNMELYVNGLSKASDTVTGLTSVGVNVNIGRIYSTHYWHGAIDEVRISNIARSSSWVTSSYNSMNDPSSFMSFGPEEAGP